MARLALSGTILALCAAAMPAAQAQVMQPALSADSASAIVNGCKAYAKEHGLHLVIAVLDQGGNLTAFQRLDGASLASIEIAQWKARGAAGFATSTAYFAKTAETSPTLSAVPYFVTSGGGEPIFTADGRGKLGGVGVSGAATADVDAACAKAGIAAAGLASVPAGQ